MLVEGRNRVYSYLVYFSQNNLRSLRNSRRGHDFLFNLCFILFYIKNDFPLSLPTLGHNDI